MTKRRQGQPLGGVKGGERKRGKKGVKQVGVEEVGIGNCLVLAAVASVASFSSAKSKSASKRESEREWKRQLTTHPTQPRTFYWFSFFTTWTTVAHASTLDQAVECGKLCCLCCCCCCLLLLLHLVLFLLLLFIFFGVFPAIKATVAPFVGTWICCFLLFGIALCSYVLEWYLTLSAWVHVAVFAADNRLSPPPLLAPLLATGHKDDKDAPTLALALASLCFSFFPSCHFYSTLLFFLSFFARFMSAFPFTTTLSLSLLSLSPSFLLELMLKLQAAYLWLCFPTFLFIVCFWFDCWQCLCSSSSSCSF